MGEERASRNNDVVLNVHADSRVFLVREEAVHEYLFVQAEGHVLFVHHADSIKQICTVAAVLHEFGNELRQREVLILIEPVSGDMLWNLVDDFLAVLHRVD